MASPAPRNTPENSAARSGSPEYGGKMCIRDRPIAALCCMEFYTHVPWDLSIPIFLINLIFYIILYAGFTFLTGSVKRGYAIATVIPMIVGIINYFVVSFRSSPVVPWDLYSIDVYKRQEKYVAYVGTYTHGSSVGIHVYDLDVEAGYMTEREVVPVNNASHVAKSNNGKYLYSIADEGVEVLKIEKDGSLKPINQVGIEGMRGCFLSTDKEGKFLFVGGYHDGKVSVVKIHEDGRLGSCLLYTSLHRLFWHTKEFNINIWRRL